MDAAQEKKARAWVQNKLYSCPACGAKGRQQLGNLVALPIIEDGKVQPKSLAYVSVICGHCGYVSLFDADRQEGQQAKGTVLP